MVAVMWQERNSGTTDHIYNH